ncbi:hypothetical protein BU17DRAFT_66492 [Hysterangium stoloniferum]|nr:hypothetical protein BU17DRAFT_66492 [Hysterangium stoloniferum]
MATIETLESKGIRIKYIGEKRMTGIQDPEPVSLIFPLELDGRLELEEAQADTSVALGVDAAAKYLIPVDPDDHHLPNDQRRSYIVGSNKLDIPSSAVLHRQRARFAPGEYRLSGPVAAEDTNFDIRRRVEIIVVDMVDMPMYVANLGKALAVVLRHGTAHGLSMDHDPCDRSETACIRAAEG